MMDPTTNLLIGALLGAAALGVAAWKLMPGMMLQIHTSPFDDVDTTAEKLKEAIEAAGWSCPGIRDMNQQMAKHDVPFAEPIRIVELCKASYAAEVLADNPEMATLMPCAFGVFRDRNGRVRISGLNTGLMGRMFGGTIARVMGQSVARDERRILEKLVA